MDYGTRDELLRRLAEAVGSVTIAHPTRVAVDGPPAAGKTTLADELAVVLRARGCSIRWARAETEGSSRPSTTTPPTQHSPRRSPRHPPTPCCSSTACSSYARS